MFLDLIVFSFIGALVIVIFLFGFTDKDFRAAAWKMTRKMTRKYLPYFCAWLVITALNVLIASLIFVRRKMEQVGDRHHG